MSKPIKTNVLRHLDAHKIPYETREYDVSDENYDGKLVADKVGLPADMIYKTLVLTGDKLKYLVCVVPVEKELDLKAVARATGNKAVAMLPQKDLLPLTGVTFPFLSNGGSSMICAWGLLAFIKAADTRQNASFAVRLVRQRKEDAE